MSNPSPAVVIGAAEQPQTLLTRYANRHGLVAGATGTGKTVTLQVLAEGFADLGVPVFCTDIKGDLSGIGAAATPKPALLERAAKLGLSEFAPRASTVQFWDVFGEQGAPLRATVSELGPLLLSRLLGLSEVQSGVLTLAFKFADDRGLLLLDLKDLRALLQHVGENAKALSAEYGLVSTQSIAAVQRALLGLSQQGAEAFFGEPALQLTDLMRRAPDGRGVVNLLSAEKLYQQPQLYATCLLWLMGELFEELPEAGDADLPKLVLFFDEAHLLFKDAPKVLVDRIEQVVRLIRSKGVGIYFVTQSPLDLPDTVLGQLGNRVQHALRAFTPRDQKAVRAAAETFRANPRLDVASVIGELGVGEALVSTLQAGGVPSMVERCLICPPHGRIGPLSAEERMAIDGPSALSARYRNAIDRESAYEVLATRADAKTQASTTPPSRPSPAAGSDDPGWFDQARRQPADRRENTGGRSSNRQTVAEAAIKSAVRSASSSIGREIGRQLLRGLLGSLTRR